MVYIGFLRNNSTIPPFNCWTFLFFLIFAEKFTHMHTNKGVARVEKHLHVDRSTVLFHLQLCTLCGIPASGKINAAHLINENERINVLK